MRDEFYVLRQDDNGIIYLMSTHATRDDAQREAETFEARAHKQMYYVVDRPELDAMARREWALQLA